MLGGHVFPFSDPHPVLTGGCTSQIQRPGNHGVDHPIDFIPFCLISLFPDDNQMNIAVTGMAQGIAHDFAGIHFFPDRFYQFRILGVRHGHIR